MTIHLTLLERPDDSDLLLQLLSAQLEEADPSVFDIIRKVRQAYRDPDR